MLDNSLMAYSNRKRSCGKMCNHFATAPFQLVNQIFEFGDMLVSLGCFTYCFSHLRISIDII